MTTKTIQIGTYPLWCVLILDDDKVVCYEILHSESAAKEFSLECKPKMENEK